MQHHLLEALFSFKHAISVNPTSAALRCEADQIDALTIQGQLLAQSKCCKLCMGQVHFSEVTTLPQKQMTSGNSPFHNVKVNTSILNAGDVLKKLVVFLNRLRTLMLQPSNPAFILLPPNIAQLRKHIMNPIYDSLKALTPPRGIVSSRLKNNVVLAVMRHGPSLGNSKVAVSISSNTPQWIMVLKLYTPATLRQPLKMPYLLLMLPSICNMTPLPANPESRIQSSH